MEDMLQAAARVLAREGYEGATTNKIAAVSGYGVGSLYDYFPNKDSLVAALIERHAAQMSAVAETAFGPDAEAPLPEAVRSWVGMMRGRGADSSWEWCKVRAESGSLWVWSRVGMVTSHGSVSTGQRYGSRSA